MNKNEIITAILIPLLLLCDLRELRTMIDNLNNKDLIVVKIGENKLFFEASGYSEKVEIISNFGFKQYVETKLLVELVSKIENGEIEKETIK